MKKITNINGWSNFFVKIEFITCFFIVLFTVNNDYNKASLFFSLSFIVLLVLLFNTLSRYKLKKENFSNFILLILIVLLAFSAILIDYSSISISFDYFKKYVMFCCTIILLFIVSIVTINKKTLDFIFVLNILLGYVFVYIYFFKETSYMGKYLTFNFTNSNLSALWLMQIILYLFIATLYFKKNIIKLVTIVCIVFLTFFLFKTGSRTSLITLIFFIAISLYILIRRNVKFNKIIITIIVLSPLIVAIFYMMLIQYGGINIFNFMGAEGKSMYSRQNVWIYAFQAIRAHPVLGAYYQISNGTGMSQMHNTHIDVWASYGIIVFVLLMIYMIRIISNVNSVCKSKIQTFSIMAFLVVIVNGMGEAALFSGGQGIYILSCCFLLIARNVDL